MDGLLGLSGHITPNQYPAIIGALGTGDTSMLPMAHSSFTYGLKCCGLTEIIGLNI